MKIIIEFPNDLINKIVDGIMENFPEASATLQCIGWKYDQRKFTFVDSESGERYNLTEERLHRGFSLMFTNYWPKGCTRVPMSTDWETWDEWLCQSDATDFDAFVQLCCFGRVIYG